MSIGSDLGFAAPRTGYEPDNSLVLPKDFLGLEFEFENVTRSIDPALDWACLVTNKEDGSLRNYGQEFVFERPLFGKDATDVIRGLCAHAKKNKYTTGLRTGIHVHIDARNIGYPQLRWWLVLNALLEPAIYRWVGAGREENVFCLPWYSTDAVLPVLREIYRKEGTELGLAASRLAQKKYSGLNLDCLRRFGSIEYRHLQTTTDADRVLRWVNICQRFKAASDELANKPGGYEPVVWLKGGQALDLFFWKDLLKAQFEDLDYPDFLRDVRTKGLPTALEIVREGPQFTISVSRANEKVKSYLASKKPEKKDEALVMTMDAVNEVPVVLNTLFPSAAPPPNTVPPPTVEPPALPGVTWRRSDFVAVMSYLRQHYGDFPQQDYGLTPGSLMSSVMYR